MISKPASRSHARGSQSLPVCRYVDGIISADAAEPAPSPWRDTLERVAPYRSTM
jgi:hypothetical protein